MCKDHPDHDHDDTPNDTTSGDDRLVTSAAAPAFGSAPYGQPGRFLTDAERLIDEDPNHGDDRELHDVTTTAGSHG